MAFILLKHRLCGLFYKGAYQFKVFSRGCYEKQGIIKQYGRRHANWRQKARESEGFLVQLS